MDKPQSEKDTSKKSSEVTFEDLGVCKELCDAVRLLKWNTPTAIQQEAIPVALSGKDIIGLAQTGSGKTGAFAVPIIQALLDKGSHAFFALVLTPTRELAVQIQEQFNALGKGIGIKCAVIVGGMDMVTQTISLGKKPHVVIATPGRLVDHLENTKGFSLRSLKYLVMDEADRILNMDFETAMNKILKVIPRERHTYLYSATMTSKVAKLKRASLQDPVKVEPMETSAHKFSTVDTLTQHLLFIPAKHKEIYLVWVLNELKGNSFIIFCNTCMAVQRITLMLRHLGFQAVPIHGQMTQSKRLGALNKFKSQERSVLVASDVASRGLDIPHVDCVLNYDVPLNPKDYIHRVGRTARAGRAGKSVTFVSQYDIELYLRIEHLIGKKLPVFPYSKEEVMTFMDTVAEACRIAKLEQTEQNKKKKQRKRKHDDDEEDTEQSRGIRTKFKKRNMKEQKKK